MPYGDAAYGAEPYGGLAGGPQSRIAALPGARAWAASPALASTTSLTAALAGGRAGGQGPAIAAASVLTTSVAGARGSARPATATATTSRTAPLAGARGRAGAGAISSTAGLTVRPATARTRALAPGISTASPPVPRTVAPSPAHQVTYLFTEVFSGRVLAELPLTGVQFTLALNKAGQFNGMLSIEDPLVASADWIDATIPMKRVVWADIDGTLAYGGLITNRSYSLSKPGVQLQATDPLGYLQQRLQAQDYSTQWYSTPASAGDMAYTILTDALAVPSSIPIDVLAAAEAPEEFWVTLNAPITQRQTVQAILTQLNMMGYQVGIDYTAQPAYGPDGTPTLQIALAYPRAGRVAGESGLVLDASYAIGDPGLEFDEDGAGMANSLVEMLAATGGVTGSQSAQESLDDGFPLIEAVMTHASLSPSALPDAVVEAFETADLALYAYPVIAPALTLPLFDDTGSGAFPSFGDWTLGDDALLYIPEPSGSEPPPNPRFPKGLSYFYRIVSAQITIADAGLSTVTFTMNVPPSTTPPIPPQGSH